MDAANPSAAENYRPHPMGYCCVDCNASAAIGQAVRHTSRCDLAPKSFVLPDGQAEGASSKRSVRRGSSVNTQARRDLARSAKAGMAYADGFDDVDLTLAIRSGAISVSDAMNQDG